MWSHTWINARIATEEKQYAMIKFAWNQLPEKDNLANLKSKKILPYNTHTSKRRLLRLWKYWDFRMYDSVIKVSDTIVMVPQRSE